MALYLLSNICLLVDVFQAFLNNSLYDYQLDPVYFVSAPQFAWNAFFTNIDRPIPLITDPKMYRIIQLNIRHVICHASVRYARAINKLMGSLYDFRQPTFYIMAVDPNNLYGWAMLQDMHDGDFEWLSQQMLLYGTAFELRERVALRSSTLDYLIIGKTKQTKNVLFSRWT